jgi:hypothetical protein
MLFWHDTTSRWMNSLCLDSCHSSGPCSDLNQSVCDIFGGEQRIPGTSNSEISSLSIIIQGPGSCDVFSVYPEVVITVHDSA